MTSSDDDDEDDASGSACQCCKGRSLPWRAVVTVTSCVLVEATMGVTYATGNLMPYMTSYLRNVTGETSLDYSQSLWISNSLWLTLAAFVSLFGLLEQRMFRRPYFLIGLFFNASSFFGMYWAVQLSFGMTIGIFGVMQGLAQAVLYPLCLNLAIEWFPHRKGIVAGLAMGGYGGGAFIWNQIVTQWINPHNLQPDLKINDDLYFTQSDILKQVPTCFVVLGAALTGVQVLCFLTFTYPPKSSRQGQTEVEVKVEDGETEQEMTENLEKPEKGKEGRGGSFHSMLPKAFVKKGKDKQKETMVTEKEKKEEDREEEGEEKEEAGVSLLTNNDGELISNQNKNEKNDNSSSNPHTTSKPDGKTTVVNTKEYSLLQVVTSRITWLLWLTNFFTDFSFFFIPAFYKTYGQTFIPDDHLLSLIASFAAVFNAASRPLWGLVGDRIGCLPTILLSQGLLAVMAATMVLCEESGAPAMFFAWVCCVYACLGGYYALMPAIFFSIFGPKNFVFGMGMSTNTAIISTFLTVPLATAVVDAFGWKGIFFVASAGSFASMLSISSLLVSCGCPLSPNVREGLLARRRQSTKRRHSSSATSQS